MKINFKFAIALISMFSFFAQVSAKIIITNNQNNSLRNIFTRKQQVEDSEPIPGMIGKFPRKIKQILDQFKSNDVNLEKDAFFRNRVLLYGPPGNGKSSLVRKIKEQIDNCELITLNGSTIIGPYIGSGPECIQKTLDEATDILDMEKEKKVIVFIDEIDAIASDVEGKNRVDYKACVQELWLQLDYHKFNSRLFFFFATNEIYNLNRTFLDRFASNIIEIRNPDYYTRKELLITFFNKADIQVNDSLINYLAFITNRFSVRAIEDLVNDIRANAQDNKINIETILSTYGQINKKNYLYLFSNPLKKLKLIASVSVSILQIYESARVFKSIGSFLKHKLMPES